MKIKEEETYTHNSPVVEEGGAGGKDDRCVCGCFSLVITSVICTENISELFQFFFLICILLLIIVFFDHPSSHRASKSLSAISRRFIEYYGGDHTVKYIAGHLDEGDVTGDLLSIFCGVCHTFLLPVVVRFSP